MRSYLSILLFFCFACEYINAAQDVKAEDVAVFVPKKTDVSLLYGSEKNYPKDVEKFCSPALVYVDGVLVAFAEAKYTGTGLKLSADIVARDISVDKNSWETQVLDQNSWKTHVAVSKNKDSVDGYHAMMNPGAVVNDKKIYLLLGSKTTDGATTTRGTGSGNWDIELVVGEVNGIAENKIVSWGGPTSLKESFEEELKKLQKLKDYNVKTITGSAGAPIVTSDGAFVFILKVETDKDESEPVNVIAKSGNNGTSWDIMKVITEKEGKYPAVVEWEDGKLLVMISKDGYREVYELDTKEKTLTETDGKLSRVWGNNKQRQGSGNSNSLIKANISGKKVLLFAQTMKDKKYQLQLWMTNGYRVYNAGPVSDEQENDISSVLLYAEDMLFLLYDRPENPATGYFLRPLADALQRMKEALGTWAAQDAALSKPCDGGVKCGESVAVDGLVGFLSDGGNTSHWADKYLCVNATVSNAVRKVENGFEFKGAGSGAQWLVNTNEQNHPYHFANCEFTLVATVVIHEVPGGISPVLSLALGKQMVHERRLGLWYDETKRWHTRFSADDESNAMSWEPKKAYMVAITLQEEKGNVYVDGKQLGGVVDMSGLKESLNVSHFSIGRDIEEKGGFHGHMIVTDVFLYNRKLSDSEFKRLVRRKERLAPKPEAPRPTPQGPGVHTGGSGGVGVGVGGNGGSSGHTETNIVSGGAGHDANNTAGGGNENSSLNKDGFERFLNTHVSLALLLLLFVCGRGQLCLF